MISEEVLEKDKEWIEEHGSFLSDDEKSVVEYLDSIREITISFHGDEEKEETEIEKIKKTFEELEQLLDEQKQELLKLKKLTLDG